MKKVISIAVALYVLVIICTGCSSKAIEYDQLNQGYDLSLADKVIFRAYHSDTDDHKWEQIAELSYEPHDNYYVDIDLEGGMGSVTGSVKETIYGESSDGAAASTESNEKEFFNYATESFKGNIPGWKDFAIKKQEGEQLYRVYCINNTGQVHMINDLALDQTYDDEGFNLDNILITVELR